MATISITSNDGKLDSASAVLEVSATNPEYNQPALRIKQAGERGGAAEIRMDGPNPDIEFVETGLTGPDPGAGKYEIAVQADRLQINGRKADNTGFETIVVFQRLAILASGQLRIRTLAEGKVSSRSLMLPLSRRRIPLAVGFCMSKAGRSNIGARMDL